MITHLIKKNGNYFCNNCKMKQPKLFNAYCWFCEFQFSNYEEEMIKIFEGDYNHEING